MMQATQIGRIGFDMDGVLLYNPSRVFRALISRSKQAHLFPRKELEFYHPKTNLEKLLWVLVHQSSFKLADGFRDLENFARNNQVELHIVSARFACLQADSKKWLKRLNRQQIFTSCNFNDQDEQPHLFKARMIEKLKLDYFVEDNFDVVHYLATTQTQTEIWWLSNMLDQRIAYPHKFVNFKEVVAALSQNK